MTAQGAYNSKSFTYRVNQHTHTHTHIHTHAHTHTHTKRTNKRTQTHTSPNNKVTMHISSTYITAWHPPNHSAKLNQVHTTKNPNN